MRRSHDLWITPWTGAGRGTPPGLFLGSMLGPRLPGCVGGGGRRVGIPRYRHKRSGHASDDRSLRDNQRRAWLMPCVTRREKKLCYNYPRQGCVCMPCNSTQSSMLGQHNSFKPLYNVGLMLGQRRRRWINIKPALDHLTLVYRP